MKKPLLLPLSLALAAAPLAAAPAPAKPPARTAPRADHRMDWWREARFGMFIHWGLYSVPAGEWEGRTGYGEWILNSAKIPVPTYEAFRERFNPGAFDADAWVRMAQDAGFKYIVVTTKHHEGFCLWDTKLTDWSVMSTPFKRDVMRELAEACRRHGMRLGWYHSIMDWHHPDYLPRREWESRPSAGADMDRYVAYLKGQLKELLTQYGPIDVLWFDGQWEPTWNHARGRDLYDFCRALQPGVIVNNRVDVGGGELQMTVDGSYAGDFGTPEQEVPPTGLPGVDWETCMTMNDHWGFNRADQNWKSSGDLVRKLADIASKGGNFLLNVGPDAAGRIPRPSVERLQAIGRWMRANGESIRGTSASPFPALPWGRCTQKAVKGGTRLYFHVFQWPADGALRIPGLYGKLRRAFLLEGGKALKAESRRGEVRVQVPSEAPDAIDSVIVLELAGRPDVALAPEIQAATPVFTDSLAVLLRTGRDRVQLRYTLDGSDPRPASPEAKGPVRITETCTVKARAFRGTEAVSPVSEARFEKVAPKPALPPADFQPGLRYQYFEGDFQRCSEFRNPAKAGLSPNFGLEARARDERFAFRFEGCLEVPKDGVYTFFLASDDGSRLLIDGEAVVDHDGPHGPGEKKGCAPLARGFHRIQLDYFQGTGGFDLKLQWSGPDIPRQPISDGDLRH